MFREESLELVRFPMTLVLLFEYWDLFKLESLDSKPKACLLTYPVCCRLYLEFPGLFITEFGDLIAELVDDCCLCTSKEVIFSISFMPIGLGPDPYGADIVDTSSFFG